MPKMHKNTIDLTGQTFGKLLVLAYAGRRKKRVRWRCKCLACGSVKDYQAGNLRKGLSTQCRGCPAKRREPPVFQAGYHSWKRIVQTGDICKQWDSFEAFIANMGEPPKGKRHLVRTDPAKPYQPGNCTWSPCRLPRLLTHNGRTMSISDWAQELGLSKQGLHLRLKKMTVHEALTYRLHQRLRWQAGRTLVCAAVSADSRSGQVSRDLHHALRPYPGKQV